jgi:uncharacterized protein (DUF433 family)
MTLPDFLTRDSHGYIHLTGHRIGLRHVAQLYQENYTPEMLHDHYPTIPLALIHKVIAFYLENQGEVDGYIQTCRNTLEQLAASPQSGPSAADLRRRMESQQQRESA